MTAPSTVRERKRNSFGLSGNNDYMKIIILILFTALISTLAFSQNTRTQIEVNRFLKVRENKMGVEDSLGNMIVPFIYNSLEYKNERLIARKNNIYGLLTTDNKELINWL